MGGTPRTNHFFRISAYLALDNFRPPTAVPVPAPLFGVGGGPEAGLMVRVLRDLGVMQRGVYPPTRTQNKQVEPR